ncbi:MAG: guanylate kinase [Spiroplasma sp.]|nr:guanylate kinase [Mycoplasmatales bacterium]
MRGRLIVLSGPSGVGKGTIRENLKFKDYVFSVSSTTRQPRTGEVNGVDYNFITKEEFQEKVKNGEMLEHAEFVGNYYGTDKQVVEELLITGKNVLLEIECQGALQVLEKVKDTLSVFIIPPSLEELERRLTNRNTEDKAIIKERLLKSKKELCYQEHYKYVVVNDELDKVVKKVDDIFMKEIYAK